MEITPHFFKIMFWEASKSIGMVKPMWKYISFRFQALEGLSELHDSYNITIYFRNSNISK